MRYRTKTSSHSALVALLFASAFYFGVCHHTDATEPLVFENPRAAFAAWQQETNSEKQPVITQWLVEYTLKTDVKTLPDALKHLGSYVISYGQPADRHMPQAVGVYQRTRNPLHCNATAK